MNSRPGKHPYHAAGLYYLQDPHAQVVAEILAPQPGERVLDLAASPGGKTTHIASCLQNQGLLVANEIKTKRIGHLASNLERWGARNAVITNETPERLAEVFGPFFDRVLVDAPCSGEGMFRKDPAARLDWSEDLVAGCAVRQTAILNYAARLVRPGGWLCYSTCTFAPEEDEQVVVRFLEEHHDFNVILDPNRLTNHKLQVTSHGFRLWPHLSPGEGHFVALLQRTGEAITERRAAAKARAALELPRSLQNLWDAWCSENLLAPLEAAPALVGARLYAIPEGLPNLAGLRVLHPGWWLGDVKKDRFEPAHALAMGISSTDARRVLSLPSDGLDVQKYLRGETLHSDGEDGWVLVAVQAINPGERVMAFPIGWGKRVQGIVKNHYPRGLLWL